MSATANPQAIPAVPPSGSVAGVPTRHFLGFMTMVLGMFMAILDIQIVSASISDIQAGLAASPDEASWVQTSYLIAETVMIPLSGFLSRLLSTRVLFTISAAGFTIFSLLCATASSLPVMILARACQGFLGGAMIPTVFATAFILFRGPARGSVSVLIGLTATLAPTIGPTLGGYLTESLSWHWLFLINVPIGAFIAVVVWSTMDIDRGDRRLFGRFDWLGLAAMAVFLGSMEYVMEEGPRWDWLDDPTIATLAAAAVISGIFFFWRALFREDPIVELRAFANGNFAIGSVFAFLIGIGLYGAVYLVPLFLGRIRGFNSMQIGETMFVTGAAMFLAAPIVGRLSRVLDLRILMGFGLATTALAMWWTSTLTAQSGFAELWLPLSLRGIGTMFAMVPVNQVALGTLPPAKIKNASGLFNLMRNLGGAVGLALINTIVIDRSAAHRLHLQEGMNWARSGVSSSVDAISAALSGRLGDLSDKAALARVSAMVTREALILSYNDVLVTIAILFALATPLVVFIKLPKPGAGGGGAH
ncbi:DHA2 family efflux MFS transporter permease subunit [Pararoseomonas indoligenes]|uniref:DHA2 family efflux MFS transporter permease subunit n=1 Tax=Roseomonas indoligenes TaxID=2820811 RepID=A0A940MUC6_9PROT|nr:DHA2 family efflux MFS transporter permease subunit [Pararoseomonas indoligenes]MBP0491858.1 DHA2 family efflux MFS transporter permease subunit [Pararoseomonas indoligenes]